MLSGLTEHPVLNVYSSFVIIYTIAEGGIFYAKLQHDYRRYTDAPEQLLEQIYHGSLQNRLRNREPDRKPLCIKWSVSSPAPTDVTQRRGKHLLSKKNLQRKEVSQPDFQAYYDRIHAPNSRVNISFCWLEYKEAHPDGYEKTQFYELYSRFVKENYGGNQISMAVNRKSGEKMYIDWVGDQPELLTDVETGEIQKVHVFNTTLGISSLIYAEAFPNEKLSCFIEGCTHAVSFYGAVAKHFVPDNLKTAVTKHTKDELILQSTFSDLEDFYGTVVLPPPARKPKGKPTVENHVRYLETHLIEKLKEKIFTSYEELNAEIK